MHHPSADGRYGSGFLTMLMGVTCIGYDHNIALYEYSQGRATRPRAFPCSPSPHALHLILPLQVLLLPATYIGLPQNQHTVLPLYSY